MFSTAPGQLIKIPKTVFCRLASLFLGADKRYEVICERAESEILSTLFVSIITFGNFESLMKKSNRPVPAT